MAAFSWTVAVLGYEWRGFVDPKLGPNLHPFDGDPEPLGTWKALVPLEWKFRTYEPLKKYPGLFRTFGTTAASYEAIQAFANEFGHLGEGRFPFKESSVQDDQNSSVYEMAKEYYTIPQPYKEWAKAIGRMRQALSLWDNIRGGGGTEKEFRDLHEIVDGQLGHMRVTPRFEFKKFPAREPALYLVPTTLGGAMWLQLAQAIAGDKKYRACEACGRWFELSPDTGRTSKHYCGEACRSRAYRARKERARQLREDGKTLRQIAKELGSHVETVKKWLAP